MEGKTISHYLILEKLGEGGMGVVYKAEDTRLKRTVALKFLSANALSTEDSKTRFQHEAQAAASLDHPNICGIYEIGEAEGRLYMAMPFIEGKGLDKRIAEGPRPVAEILEIAIQVSEALEEAHSKLIVHRDIKPANVMIQDRGRGRLHCVLMDFGLARLSQATALTREGSQLGTAAYMSPEQVQGAPVDSRTDIWSLGIMVYEMAVGRRPFSAEYEQALFYGILNEQPEPMTSLRTGLPMELERIAGKCLAKEPHQRYQSCTDLIVDLQALKRTLEGSGQRGGLSTSRMPPASREGVAPQSFLTPAGSDPPPPVVREEPPSNALAAAASFFIPGLGQYLQGRRNTAIKHFLFAMGLWIIVLGWIVHLWSMVDAARYDPAGTTASSARNTRSMALLLIAACLLGVVVGAAFIAWVRPTPAAPDPQPEYTLRRITWDGRLAGGSTLSEQGDLIAYGSDRGSDGNLDIWLQQVDGGSLIQLTKDPADEIQPSFSPDATKIAFTRVGQGVYIVPTLGGDAFLVAQNAYSPKFAPDNKTIAYLVDGKLFHTSISMGTPQQLLAGYALDSPPLWVPDGSHIIIAAAKSGVMDWWAAPIDGSEPKSLHAREAFSQAGMEVRELEAMSWSGRDIVIEYEGNLFRVPVDLDSRRTGVPVRLTFGSGLEGVPAGSPDGKITFMAVEQRRDIFSLKLDPRTGTAVGAVEALTDAASRDTSSDISLDSQRLVYLSNRSGFRDIWMKDLASGKETNLSNDAADQDLPKLSADGSNVAYLVEEEGKHAIYTRPAEGGIGKLICADCGRPRSWSADGSMILFERGSPSTIFTLDIQSGQQTEILKAADGALSSAHVSDDGKWVAMQWKPAEGTAKLVIAPFRGNQPVAQSEWVTAVEDKQAEHPAWSLNGNILYYASARMSTLDLWMQRLDPATKKPLGAPQVLLRFPNMRHSLALMGPDERTLSASRDRLVFPMTELGGSVWLMEPKAGSSR